MDSLDELRGRLVGKVIEDIQSLSSGFLSRIDDRGELDIDIVTGDYDSDSYGEIAIKFTDGTYITTWSSEWGGIVFRSSLGG